MVQLKFGFHQMNIKQTKTNKQHINILYIYIINNLLLVYLFNPNLY